MKYLKLIVISFIVFFGLATAVSIFIPSQIRVSRGINIGANNLRVMGYISNLSLWKHWYPGFNNMQLTNATIQNNKVVKAQANHIQIHITHATDSMVNAVLKKQSNTINISWQAAPHQSTDSLTLYANMDFRLRWYPWEKFSSLLLDKSYGDVLQQGLTNLKNLSQ